MFCGDAEVGYLGEDVRLDDGTLPIPLSKKANVLIVQYALRDNFTGVDFDTHTYSLGISPVIDQSQSFTIDIPTDGPIRIWGASDRRGGMKEFLCSNGFNLPKDLSSHQITAVFDFDTWVMTLGLDNLDTTSVPLPEHFRHREFETLDLGLTKFPKKETPIKAWNSGSGEYSGRVQKVYIGTPGGASCLKLNKHFKEHGKSCSEFLKRFCMTCENTEICGDLSTGPSAAATVGAAGAAGAAGVAAAHNSNRTNGANRTNGSNGRRTTNSTNGFTGEVEEVIEDIKTDIEDTVEDVESAIENKNNQNSGWIWLLVIALVILLIFFLMKKKN